MNNASLELGGTNWAEKEGSLLGYAVNDTNNKYSAKEFTFGRGTNLSATRIGQTGLIEKGRENVLLQSNQFDTTWGSNGITLTGGKLGYDGSNNAWLAEKSNQSTRVEQNISGSGVTTFSAYLKAGTLNWSILNIQNVSQYYDLENGVLGTTSGTGSLRIDFGMEAVGNGWYRCFATTNQSYSIVRIYPATANNNNSGTSGNIYIQDAQLEQGLVASPYIPTTTTTAQAGVLENTPRLNYTTGVANPYLLLEPSRTNLVVQSEYPSSNTTSGYPYVRGGATAIYNYGISPEGLQNSTLISGSNGNNGVQVNLTSSAINQDWSYSFYIKGTLGETINLRFETSPYASQSQEYITFTGDWQRIERTISYNATAHTSKHLYITFLSASTATQFEIYGLQAEANASYATSYIPTYSTSATRAADTCYKTDASDVIGQTEGTIYWNFKSDNTSLYKRFALSDGTTNNWIFVGMEENGGLVRGYIRNNGSIQFTYTGSVNLANTRVKIALAYKENDFALYVNGSLIGVDNSGTIPLCDRIDIGSQNPTWNISASTETYQAEVYKERLTNAELATLTTI